MIRLHEWCDDAEERFSEREMRDLPEVKRQVEKGIAQLWRCESERNAAWCVTRLDRDACGFEWVVVLFEGSGLHEFVPLFLQAAKDRNIPVRAHMDARRKGLLRMLKRYGAVAREVVVTSSW